MLGKATRVSEIDQILQVHALLHDIGVAPSPRGTVFLGQLLRAVVGNMQRAKGWSSYGTLEVATERGKVEIDYLDIVSMQKVLSSVQDKSLAGLFQKRRPSKKDG